MQPSLKLVVTLSGICGCEIATELEEVLPTCQFVEEAGAKKAEVIACSWFYLSNQEFSRARDSKQPN